jgi:HlyD family secretion protein
VLDRNINVGDTVVDSSSNNSTSIFTLAENLREMQIEAGVGELDIASIHKGQTVRFTLESLPGQRFTGTVDILRMIPVVTNNVVSYTVIINVENQDGTLLPGMTCAVDFIVERVENALLVANAALRYQPTRLNADQISEMVFNASLANMNDEQKQAAIEAREQAKSQSSDQKNNSSPGLSDLMRGGNQNSQRMLGGGGRRAPQGQQQGPSRVQNAVVFRNLWYANNEGKLEVMQVRTGVSDGSITEIRTREEDLEGREVILREKVNAPEKR